MKRSSVGMIMELKRYKLVEKSKECIDTVGNNNVLVSVVTGVFRWYIKYSVKFYSTQTAKTHVNAFEIILSAQAAMSSVQLPPPSTRGDVLYNDLLSLIEFMELHGGTATRVIPA